MSVMEYNSCKLSGLRRGKYPGQVDMRRKYILQNCEKVLNFNSRKQRQQWHANICKLVANAGVAQANSELHQNQILLQKTGRYFNKTPKCQVNLIVYSLQ